jgi:hypothetical protein
MAPDLLSRSAELEPCHLCSAQPRSSRGAENITRLDEIELQNGSKTGRRRQKTEIFKYDNNYPRVITLSGDKK